MKGFSAEELVGMYELARLYFEMGYLSAAERILGPGRVRGMSG